jgi:hypothetical protein
MINTAYIRLTMGLRLVGLFAALLLASTASRAQVPPNDNFVNRIAIVGLSNSVTGSNVGASREPGEPTPIGNPGANSVWWRWTAPTNGTAFIDTIGSSFDTILGIYTGTSVSSLTEIVSDDDSGGNQNSRVFFYALIGTTYQIEVDGYNGTNGNITLNVAQFPPELPQITSQPQNQFAVVGDTATFYVSADGSLPLSYQWLKAGAVITGATNYYLSLTNVQVSDAVAYRVIVTNPVGTVTSSNAFLTVYLHPPTNDSFANRISITGRTNTTTGYNVDATKEPGEPTPVGNIGGKSVWWSWTAPTNGTVTIDTIGSSFDTILGIYAGSSVSNLVEIVGDDEGGGYLTSQVIFFGVAGISYQIEVDGFDGTFGPITLSITQALPQAVQILNQPQRNQALLAGGSAAFYVGADGSLPITFQWFRNNLPIPGANEANFVLTNAQLGDAGVYTVVVSNGVGGVTSSNAYLSVFQSPPTNDSFASRIAITGQSNTVTGYNTGATHEPGEPDHNSNPGQVSVWWKWTPLVNGTVVIDTAGSSFDTVLAIYRGSSVSNLKFVTADDNGGGEVSSRVSFFGMAGNTYQIAVDGSYGANGNIVLNLTQTTALPPQTFSTYSTAYTFSTLAGYPGSGSADGAGNQVQFSQPYAVAADSAGNVYVADTFNHTIRKITPAAVVTTIAGLAGTAGSADGTNSAARFNSPQGIAADAAGNLYVADTYNYTIRKLTPTGSNWVVTTIAGLAGFQDSDDGPGNLARFGGRIDFFSHQNYGPQSVAVDNAGNVYVADTVNFTIRKITPVGTNWMVSTIAGLAGNEGTNDGPGTVARFGGYPDYPYPPDYIGPAGVTVDNTGNVFVSDTLNHTIRKIAPTGSNWVVSTIAGSVENSGFSNGTGTNATFNTPGAIAASADGSLYLADIYNFVIRKLTWTGSNWAAQTFAGSGQSGNNDATGSNASFLFPTGISLDAAGNVYVADPVSETIRKISPAAVVRTVAGSIGSFGANDGTGSTARFGQPTDVAVDSLGNLFVVDKDYATIRMITPAGVVSTFAGLPGNIGSDDGAGNDARFRYPQGIAVDLNNNLYVADTDNGTIRKITPSGVVTTIAGQPPVGQDDRFADGTNNTARFNQPRDLAVDNAGNIYVTDTDNNAIRKVTPAGTNWVVTTIAGFFRTNGIADGIGTNALFNGPTDIALDGGGSLYVADSANATIRRIARAGTNWVVTTIAGIPGLQGPNDGAGAASKFNLPQGLAVDGSTNIFVADSLNHTIRKIAPVGTNWIVSTIAGLPESQGSADGVGSTARFYSPQGITVDGAGNLYVADTFNNTVRKGVFTSYTPTNLVTYVHPPTSGQLVVTLLPPEANGQWRFPWEVAWRNSGQPATNLVAGNYNVEFRPRPGWLAIPSSLTIAVTNNVALTNLYYPTLSSLDPASVGTLTVTLGPNPPSGAGWRFLGDTTPYYPSGYSTNLAAGSYLIEFAPVSGRSKPPNVSVQILPGLPTLLAENYLLASSAPGGVLLPTPVPPANINDLNNHPFGFNGQLQSDNGYGSGVAVQANVVLTAAHLVFNDQTLAYVSQINWYFQMEAGTFEPKPQTARGWYVLGGYAAQRTNDLQSGLYGPEQSTPQSRNLDVAALYFLSPVAGGGHGGFLPSDTSPNPWLTGSSLKMLVGYPVDGSQFGDASIVLGKMYQTAPQPFTLAQAMDPIPNQQVYTASWFLSYPGNSGGPVYVQLNGYYYPAGVYLGTLYNGVTPYASAVRAIDSTVVSLITQAASLGDTGTNNSGGGVITIIPNQSINALNPGYLQFQLGPPAAVQAGAGWRLTNDPAFSSATNYIRAVLSTNAFAVEFKQIAGWITPTNQAVTVLPNQITTYAGFYSVSNPTLSANSVGIALRGTTGTTYRIERSSTLKSGTWAAISTNTITTNGFNFVLPKPGTNAPTFYRAVWLP